MDCAGAVVKPFSSDSGFLSLTLVILVEKLVNSGCFHFLGFSSKVCWFAFAVRQPDAELPTSFGKEAEPRIILRTRDESIDAAAVEPKDSEQDTSTVAKETEDVGIDPAAYDAMTPTQKKLFDLRLKLVSWAFFLISLKLKKLTLRSILVS